MSARLHEGRPERLLVIAAHPGDADDAIAGSVARWVELGAVACLACCTSGDGTADDAATDPLTLAADREREQRAAAATVGYEAVTFLHRPDGALANDLALREQLVRLIRTFRPDAVAAPDPRVLIHSWGAVNHVDHRAAGAAALDAVQPAAANALAFPGQVRHEALEPHEVRRLYLFWSGQPSHVVDIGTTMALKVRAVEAHARRPERARPGQAQLRSWARSAGAAVGVDAAEAFAIVDLAWP
ncbi:MAG: PIG-L family deacetylase [Chloroflexota bacterium]